MWLVGLGDVCAVLGRGFKCSIRVDGRLDLYGGLWYGNVRDLICGSRWVGVFLIVCVRASIIDLLMQYYTRKSDVSHSWPFFLVWGASIDIGALWSY